jgi:O-antigen/teichoic acid export membrane protein
MDEPRGVFKNSSVLAVARLADRMSGLVVAFVITRWLGAASLGVYAAAMAIYGLMAIAGQAGATTYLVREIAKHPELTGRYVVHLSVLAAGAAGLFTAALFVVVPHLGYADQLQTSVEIIALGLVPATINNVQEAAFVAHGRVELETRTTLVKSVVNVVACIVLINQGYSIVAVITAYVVAEYLVTIAYYLQISREIARLPFAFEWRLAARLFWEMKAFTGSSIISALFSRPEIILLSLFSTEAQIGYYSAALKVAEVWTFVPEVFSTNIFPLLSRTAFVADERFAAIQRKSIKYLLAFALPVTAGLLATADQIIPLLYGDGFGPSVPELRILAGGVTFLAVTAVFWRSLAARHRQDAVLWTQVVTIVVRLGVGAVLIAWLDSRGAAWATLCGTFLNLILLTIVVHRCRVAVPFWRIGWRLATAAALCGTAAWLVPHSASYPVTVAVAGVVYIGAVVVLGAFAPEDWALFRRALPSRLAIARK